MKIISFPVSAYKDKTTGQGSRKRFLRKLRTVITLGNENDFTIPDRHIYY